MKPGGSTFFPTLSSHFQEDSLKNYSLVVLLLFDFVMFMACPIPLAKHSGAKYPQQGTSAVLSKAFI